MNSERMEATDKLTEFAALDSIWWSVESGEQKKQNNQRAGAA